MAHQIPPPGTLLRALLRTPVWLYRLRAGRLLGGRFLLLRHRGRTSGVWRENVLEVVGRDEALGAYYVAAAWGRGSQWLRNVEADPRVEVEVGRRRRNAIARLLAREHGVRLLAAYAREHRLAARLLARGFGFRDMGEMATETPVVELRIANDA